jgi:hypothetical protein
LRARQRVGYLLDGFRELGYHGRFLSYRPQHTT